MLTGLIALLLRYLLLLAGSGLVAIGMFESQGDLGYCFNTATVSDGLANWIVLIASGGASIVLSIFWRIFAKRSGGVT